MSEVTLESIIANDQLSRRSRRRPDVAAEQHALGSLSLNLEKSPRTVLQKLADTALSLCRSGSAGISLLEVENGAHIFRWHAVSGAWASHLWGTMPREFSPCGTVLDRDAAQLMVHPARYFTPLAEMNPGVVEALLVPFHIGGKAVGTVWVVSHDESCHFDGEDRRLVTSLATFAAEAYERLSAISVEEVARISWAKKHNAYVGDLRPKRALQKRVLVVDDNMDAAESLAALLRHFGHEVFTAHDGHAALHAARTGRPEIVLLDLALPGVDGYEVARSLRQDFGASVRIIALTGSAGEMDRRKSVEAGFDEYWVKPLDPKNLDGLLP